MRDQLREAMQATADPVSIPSPATFDSYVEDLVLMAQQVLDGAPAPRAAILGPVLNGQPSAKLRELVPLAARKAAGAFFTGSALAERAVHDDEPAFADTATVFDPACGAGDLLVVAARWFSLGSDLTTTLQQWGSRIIGVDIRPDFVRAAKARLVLLAAARGVQGTRLRLAFDDVFPRLVAADGLGRMTDVSGVTHILLNPPYGKVAAPPGCTWGSGGVSQAATFLDRCLSDAAPGTRVVAILPDVLRTGSLYARWRAGVEARAAITSIETAGLFDSWADVDVFILRLVVGERGKSPIRWWMDAPESVARLGDRCTIRVGPVVPHRHRREGESRLYVHTRGLPAWGVYEARSAERRPFGGRTFTPPFVVVRRTSSPRDAERAVATIILGNEPIAVENHLLVLEPVDRTRAACEHILDVLRDPRTRSWLDERLRCRHLTVGAIQKLPAWEPAQ